MALVQSHGRSVITCALQNMCMTCVPLTLYCCSAFCEWPRVSKWAEHALTQYLYDVKHALSCAGPSGSTQPEHPHKVALLLGLRDAENNDQLLSSQFKMGKTDTEVNYLNMV